MANLLDDLKGILSPEDFAKIEGNTTLKTRVSKAAELLDWYGGDEPTTTTTTTTEPVRTTEPTRTVPNFDLSAIETMLDKKLGKVNELVDARVAEVVKQRGDELYNSVRAGVRTDALQLVKIYTRHQEATGKSWDDAEEVKFNDFLKANNEAVKAGNGKQYRTLTEAYNDYIQPEVEERRINAEVDKRTKATSGQHVPGTTPAPSVNSNIMHFKKRAVAGDGTATTGAQRAAALLDKRLAEQTA
jgi:hypothetical protein